MQGFEQLYTYVLESCDEEERFHFLGFEFLQRLNIVQLQNKLIELKIKVHKGRHKTDSQELQTALQLYRTSSGTECDVALEC